jgi:DNA polymerase III subunit delta
MQLRAEQLKTHLQKSLRPIYTVWGDEPLLAQEAAGVIRAAARAHGCTERQVHTVAGARFDWSGLLGSAMALSLFSERQLIDIRIPTGKPGKDGSDALQRYCQAQAGSDHSGHGNITLVQLPRLDRTQQSSAWFTALDAAGVTVRVDPIDRRALPVWIAQRLAAQQQRVSPGDEGQRALTFFADRVEGNLLAAHQEVQKLGLLYPVGELSCAQIESAVLNVARYDVFKLSEAVLAGQVARALRMLQGLQDEGEAAVLVHWALAEDIRALQRVHQALQLGKPLPMALREARVWGAKERLLERAVPLLKPTHLNELVQAAHLCDGLVKGLKHPAWPVCPWEGLQRLALMLLQHTAPAPSALTSTSSRTSPRPRRLALTG